MKEIEKTNYSALTKTLKNTISTANVLKQSFGRSQSQWMEANMACSSPTPIRNIRHLLARIEKAYKACKETEYKLKKQQIRLEMKKEQLSKEDDMFKRQLLQVDIDKAEYGIDSAMFYFRGAVKKIQHNYDCIQQILESNGWDSFEEIDFEREEEEYHIKTALIQSIRAVMSKGRICEGNLEYLEQCGINPLYAQKAIIGWMITQDDPKNKLDTTTKTLYAFIDQLYNDFKGLSKKRLEGLGVKNPFLEDVMFTLSEEDVKRLAIGQ